MNHIHNPCATFSNCDMARMVVHGTSERKSGDTIVCPEVAALCPNAFAVVLADKYAYVAFKECTFPTPNVPKAWSGFARFSKQGSKTALDKAWEWIRECDPEGDRPSFLFAYESAIRSFSSRNGARVLSHLFLHLKSAKDAGDSSQAGHRCNGDGMREQLAANGLPACSIFCTDDDYAIISNYHAWMSDVLEPIADGYCDLKEVFSGGIGKALARVHAPMLKSKRAHAPQKMIKKTGGDAVKRSRVSATGPTRGEHHLISDAAKAEVRAKVAAVRTMRAAAQAAARAAAQAAVEEVLAPEEVDTLEEPDTLEEERPRQRQRLDTAPETRTTQLLRIFKDLHDAGQGEVTYRMIRDKFPECTKWTGNGLRDVVRDLRKLTYVRKDVRDFHAITSRGLRFAMSLA